MGVTELLKIPMYQVDAFTAKVFSGNPAAVCLLDAPMDEAVMQAIAAENNLAETAFVRIDLKPFELRWFTPTTEVALCGHATLAAAHVLFSEGVAQNNSIDFQSPYQLSIAPVGRNDNFKSESITSGQEFRRLALISIAGAEEIFVTYWNKWLFKPIFVHIAEHKTI